MILTWSININSSAPEQNGRHFADDIFRWIFMNENFCILIKNLIEFCSYESNWQYLSIGWDNGLALNRRQAII